MIRDFKQREEIDFNEIFILIIKFMNYKVIFVFIIILN